MNQLKIGREKLGWSIERMAANVCVDVEKLEALESVPVADLTGTTARSILTIFESRNVVIEGDGTVRGPLDRESLDALALCPDDIAALESIADFGAGGKPLDGVRESIAHPKIHGLRAMGLLQFSTVRITIDLSFDGEPVVQHPHTVEMRVRLSARGYAALCHGPTSDVRPAILSDSIVARRWSQYKTWFGADAVSRALGKLDIDV